MGSHILTFSIMMNTVTSHGTCTIAFSIVGMIICLVLTLPRTLKKISYMSIVSFISIVSAVMITMVGVGVERPGDGKVDMTVQSNLYIGFGAVTNIIFAYAGKTRRPCPLGNPYAVLTQLSRPRHILLLHLRTSCPRNLPQSYLPPPRHRHNHVSHRRPRHLLLRRHRRRVPSSRVNLPSHTENSLRGSDPNHHVRVFRLSYISHFLFLFPLQTLTTDLKPSQSQNRRRDLRPSRLQMHLRPPLSRHRPHEQENLELLRRMGAHRDGALGRGVGYRGGCSRLQQSVVAHQRAVCELVHVWDQRGVLVVFELGTVWDV